MSQLRLRRTVVLNPLKVGDWKAKVNEPVQNTDSTVAKALCIIAQLETAGNQKCLPTISCLMQA